MNNNQQDALITGATSGIGYELAGFFAQDHHSLILVARNEQGVKKVAVELRQQYA